ISRRATIGHTKTGVTQKGAALPSSSMPVAPVPSCTCPGVAKACVWLAHYCVESRNRMTMQSEPKGTVLVVDDDDAVRSGLYWALASDYHVLQASSRDEAIGLINDEEIEVGVSDLHMPPHVDDIGEGLALIDVARAQDP